MMITPLPAMRNILLTTFMLCAHIAFAQSETTITIIDFVKIKNNKRQETLFFYENNWKVYRDIALQSGYIKSYKLLTTSADSTANFDLILITEYTDSVQFRLSEERYQKIMKATRPDGPKLLNALKPADFRQNVFFKQTETLLSAEGTKQKRKNKAK